MVHQHSRSPWAERRKRDTVGCNHQTLSAGVEVGLVQCVCWFLVSTCGPWKQRAQAGSRRADSRRWPFTLKAAVGGSTHPSSVASACTRPLSGHRPSSGPPLCPHLSRGHAPPRHSCAPPLSPAPPRPFCAGSARYQQAPRRCLRRSGSQVAQRGGQREPGRGRPRRRSRRESRRGYCYAGFS